MGFGATPSNLFVANPSFRQLDVELIRYHEKVSEAQEELVRSKETSTVRG